MCACSRAWPDRATQPGSSEHTRTHRIASHRPSPFEPRKMARERASCSKFSSGEQLAPGHASVPSHYDNFAGKKVTGLLRLPSSPSTRPPTRIVATLLLLLVERVLFTLWTWSLLLPTRPDAIQPPRVDPREILGKCIKVERERDRICWEKLRGSKRREREERRRRRRAKVERRRE